MSANDASVSRRVGHVNGTHVGTAIRPPGGSDGRHADVREGGNVAAARRVLHLVDTLEIGGAERVAVNLVNVLPRQRYQASLCTTRRDGPLADLVGPLVQRLRLNRSGRFDLRAVAALIRFIRSERIELLHAHGSSIFLARLVANVAPHPAVVWHDHFGRYAVEERPVWLYRLVTAGIAGVVTVNHPLADWARRKLRVPADRVWYAPNFVPIEPAPSSENSKDAGDSAGPERLSLPGSPENRIICVANFRPQKDHLTLIAAMDVVVRAMPTAQLLLVGDAAGVECIESVRREIEKRRLGGNVTILGTRRDVPAILKACAVGVLSSQSEGLPLALIEYGAAGLAAVATDVGECPSVLDSGRAGIVVKPGAPEELGHALVALLLTPARRKILAARLKERVRTVYGPEEGARRICDVYDRILKEVDTKGRQREMRP